MSEQARSGSVAAAMRDEFDRSFALPPTGALIDTIDLLLVRVGADPYVIRLLDVSGVLSGQKIAPVPSATPDLLGLAGIRGELVPVFALASLLGETDTAEPPSWLVLCGTSEPIGLAFACVDGYRRVPADAIRADEGTEHRGHHADEIATLSDGMRAVIAIPALVADIRGRRSRCATRNG